MIIYSLYLLGINGFNFLLKETYGIVKSNGISEEEWVVPQGRSYSKMKMKKMELVYEYNINDKSYTGKRISNLIIYPNFGLSENDYIKIYYCTFIPKYSMLFKGNIKYLIFNSIPIAICGILILILKREMLKESIIKKGVKNKGKVKKQYGT